MAVGLEGETVNANSMIAWRMSRHGVASDKRAILVEINRGMNDGRYGATCDEIEQATGLLHQTASARMNDLVREGVITVTGHKRLTRRRRPADVYALAFGPRDQGPEQGALL